MKKGQSITEAAGMIAAEHQAISQILSLLSEDAWLRTGLHPQSGPLTIEFLARRLAEHADEHIQQIKETYSMSVPAPFNEFSPPVPTLTGVSPSTVTPGTVFTITGTNLYPSGIINLFIAGNTVDSDLWFPVQDGKNEQRGTQDEGVSGCVDHEDGLCE